MKWLAFVVFLSACDGGAADDGIIDIGKTCTSPSDCDHVCVAAAGSSSGQCSIECSESSDCPSFMNCLTSSSTGDRRCFDPGGVIGRSLFSHCIAQCGDVEYFCSTNEITDAETSACGDFCAAMPDDELQRFIDCVDAEPRYQSACPAASCVLDRI